MLNLLFSVKEIKINSIVNFNSLNTVFLTQIISRRQKNADAKVVQLISRQQKWNSCWQFSKKCIFPNIQLNML